MGTNPGHHIELARDVPLGWLSVWIAAALAAALMVATGAPETTGYIWIGDSRTVGMERVCHMSDPENHIYTIAKSGMGYRWLVTEAEKEIGEIRKTDDAVTNWEYIVNLGVNDPANVNKYIDWVGDIEDATVHYVSVNPVPGKALNRKITAFNDTIKPRVEEFIDTNVYLSFLGYDAPDGLHYSERTYRDIFEYVCDDIGMAVGE